jgi:hypothetical protein
MCIYAQNGVEMDGGSVHKSAKKAKMGVGGQARAGGWDGPGRGYKAMGNNRDRYLMVGECAGSRLMAKNGLKKRK